MRRVFYIVLSVILLSGCQHVEKIKSDFQKGLKKADSVVNVAVDSISAQVTSDSSNMPQSQVKGMPVSSDEQMHQLQNVYSAILNSIKTNNLFLLNQVSYYNDSLFFITVQGIFQVLDYQPVKSLYDNLLSDINDSAWTCSLNFKEFPSSNQTDQMPTGCFARHIDNFHKFSAIIELEKEANLPLNKNIVEKAKKIEPKIKYEILNTYLGWSFYFTQENGKFYLVAIDYNQY